ncbi:hypothetical protein FOZ63_002760 [Perkinsus olseni]|uniref:MATH domain-containing protein n=1 Tax=Perkinsus olseni TaxID=32597 RepID=A0A7J6PYY2_PEROL|nr:hypothetical protein FOZ63_002760 [Perkinsus olseni]
MIYPGLVQGWKEYASTSKLTKENGWLDKESQLVFRARANIVEKDPTPLKPEWHEVRFDGRQEYDPGDEFKSPPTWKGNYKFQLAVFPGGIEPNNEQRSLAVYVHLLESRGSNAMDSLTLKIKLLNHKDPAKTITWTSVHAFDEMDQSWGCSTLIPLEDIKKGGLGWLNGKGKIVLRAVVLPLSVGEPNPREIRRRGRPSNSASGFPEAVSESLAKRTKLQ